jgi:hypothetical protein
MGRPRDRGLRMKERSSTVTCARRMLVAALTTVAAAGCMHSNPLIGKWKLAPSASPACAALDGIEFGDSTLSMELLGNKQMANVTYTRDGDRWLVAGPNGTMAFEKDADGIKSVQPFECQLLPAG